MNSVYARYLKERDNIETIELDEGFIMYQVQHDGFHVYVTDFYIVPEHRNKGLGQVLWNSLLEEAKWMKARSIGATIRKNMPYWQENLNKFIEKAELAVIYESSEDIELYKEL